MGPSIEDASEDKLKTAALAGRLQQSIECVCSGRVNLLPRVNTHVRNETKSFSLFDTLHADIVWEGRDHREKINKSRHVLL